MAERDAEIDVFLGRAGWGTATRAPLAGDASNRRYLRLERGADRAVLMDAPPGTGEDIRPFTAIARHLTALGLSAPAILADDAGAGLLLLEDLGDALFARVAEADPAAEIPLYEAAVGTLAALQAAPPPAGLAHLDPATLGEMTAPVFDWYAPDAAAGAARAMAEAIRDAAAALPQRPPVLVLRDFHAENLIWLPDRAGPAQVGLLDFQDAVTGHPAYDLVSLVEDARRDTAPALRRAAEARFRDLTGIGAAELARAMAVLGAQRNLRILGIFARLAVAAGKPRYLAQMPRVWGHLRHDLAHPALEDLRRIVDTHLPAPDRATLATFKDRCPDPTP